MAIRGKIVDDIAVIKVRGALTGGDETREVHEKVKRLISDGIKKIVIDLARVKWMNSHGLGMLMACYSSVQGVDGRLGIARSSDKVTSIMEISKINTLFDNFETIGQAVSSFR